MEFSRIDLESKKYHDLVKFAKEHDVYRRYAPKAEIIDRLLGLNKNQEAAESNISDISMPSLPEVTDDDSEPENSPAVRKIGKGVKRETRLLRSRGGSDEISEKDLKHEQPNGLPAGNVRAESRRLTFEVPQERSILGELTNGNANAAETGSLRRSRRTIAFATPEGSRTPAKTTQRRTAFVTPYKPRKTPAKSDKKPGPAESTPAPNRASQKEDESLNELRGAFAGGSSDASPIQSPSGSDSDEAPATFKREGTYEVISLDDSGRKISHEVTVKTPSSPFDASLLTKRTRSGRNTSTPVVDLETSRSDENLTGSRKSVKELRSIFEPKEDQPSVNRLVKRLSTSPNMSARVTFASPPASARRSFGRTDTRLMGASPVTVLPSTSKKAYVTNRARAASYTKPPSTKKLSSAKATPKVPIKSPSVAKEIEVRQQAVSAKKMLDAASGSKSKIPPPRRVPNFSEMHAKMYSKMESLIDVKEKIMNRAMEHNSAVAPRCATTTPKLFSTEKKVQQDRVASARAAASRPAAVRKLLSPKVSKIPQRAVPSPAAVRPLPASPRRSLKKIAEKPKPVRKLMPPNATISRLPVFSATGQKRQSRSPAISKIGGNTRSEMQVQRQKMKETIINKAPVKKVQDITGKNRQLLQSVRMNKRFELQMQHRMKSLQQ